MEQKLKEEIYVMGFMEGVYSSLNFINRDGGIDYKCAEKFIRNKLKLLK